MAFHVSPKFIETIMHYRILNLNTILNFLPLKKKTFSTLIYSYVFVKLPAIFTRI